LSAGTRPRDFVLFANNTSKSVLLLGKGPKAIVDILNEEIEFQMIDNSLRTWSSLTKRVFFLSIEKFSLMNNHEELNLMTQLP